MGRCDASRKGDAVNVALLRAGDFENGGAGDKAGLKVGDVITKVDNQVVDGSESLVATVRGYTRVARLLLDQGAKPDPASEDAYRSSERSVAGHPPGPPLCYGLLTDQEATKPGSTPGGVETIETCAAFLPGSNAAFSSDCTSHEERQS